MATVDKVKKFFGGGFARVDRWSRAAPLDAQSRSEGGLPSSNEKADINRPSLSSSAAAEQFTAPHTR